jgi:hypothetical protein
MPQDTLPDWLRDRPRTRAIICDIDDTICVQFDQPIVAAIQFLAALDRTIEVHYVTARPEASRKGTEEFLSISACRAGVTCTSARLGRRRANTRLR